MTTVPEFADSQVGYFTAKNWAYVATLRSDGSSHVTPMWISWDGSLPWFNTSIGTITERNLRRDRRITFTVADHRDPQRGYVEVTGVAELSETGADADIDQLAQKYFGIERYPWRAEGEKRVTIRVNPSRIYARGEAAGDAPRPIPS